jgi:hypothetical protein
MSARVRSSTNSYNQPWVADLSSTYVVNGKYYSGFHRIRVRSEGRTEEKIVGWKGRMAVVRYSPDKNDFSALRRGDQVGRQSGN